MNQNDMPTPRTDALLNRLRHETAPDWCADDVMALLRHGRQLERELATMQAENAELRKDKQRLNWLEQSKICFAPTYGYVPMGSGLPLPFEGWGEWNKDNLQPTLRQTIDTAMSQEKHKPSQ